MAWVRVTIIVEPENVNVWGSEKVEIELPILPDDLRKNLFDAYVRAFEALSRGIAQRAAPQSASNG